MIYCINRIKKEKVVGQRTAGKKAPDDVAAIVSKEFGGQVFHFYETRIEKKGILRVIGKYLINRKNWNSLLKIVKERDIVIVQHPYEGIKQSEKMLKKCHKSGAAIILVIHDLSTLRHNIDIKESGLMEALNYKAEIGSLLEADYVICHNSKMKKHLVQSGISEKKIYCLGIFDYLFSGDTIPERHLSKEVCIAGNLSKYKSGYLYKYINSKADYSLNLYGPNYEEQSNESITYMGILPPDKLPGVLEGAFGLVWDGDDLESCTGVAGEYIKMNNPHKCSLYFAANMPVIIWKEAALADYVIENGLGLAVDRLGDISDAVSKLDNQQYNEMVNRVISVGETIRNGINLKAVLTMILDCDSKDADE